MIQLALVNLFDPRQRNALGLFHSQATRIDGEFSRSATQIAGFRVGDRYGWLRVRFDGGGPGDVISTGRLVDWALGTVPGQAVAAGVVPEPTTGALTGLGLLALGARGVRARRRATA